MIYIATILIQFEDSSQERADGRAEEMAKWAIEGLDGGDGSSNAKIVRVIVSELESQQ